MTQIKVTILSNGRIFLVCGDDIKEILTTAGEHNEHIFNICEDGFINPIKNNVCESRS